MIVQPSPLFSYHLTLQYTDSSHPATSWLPFVRYDCIILRSLAVVFSEQLKSFLFISAFLLKMKDITYLDMSDLVFQV